jgi:hypothetical protein
LPAPDHSGISAPIASDVQSKTTCSIFLKRVQKLRLDFIADVAKIRAKGRGTMSSDDADLIERLCTRAGMMMEDASAIALSVRVDDQCACARHLACLEGAVADMQKLIDTASALLRQSYAPSLNE